VNTLGRRIEKNEIVFVKASELKHLYRYLHNAAFICNGEGFGVSDKTGGTAIFGNWADDGTNHRIEGCEIDANITRKFHELRFKKWEGDLPIPRSEFGGLEDLEREFLDMGCTDELSRRP